MVVQKCKHGFSLLPFKRSNVHEWIMIMPNAKIKIARFTCNLAPFGILPYFESVRVAKKKQITLRRVIPTMTCQNAGLTLISLYIHQVRVGFKFHVSLISFSSLLPPLQPLFVPSSTATICAGLICSCSTALCIVKFTPHICQCPYKKQRPEATSSPLELLFPQSF